MKSRDSSLCFRSFLAATTVAFAGLAPASAQERVKIPRTSVTITAPAGFAVATGDDKGLVNAATGSSITITEQPADAYAALAERFASPKSLSAGYAAQGVTIRSVKQIAGAAGPVPLAMGAQTSKGKEFAKYYALLKGDKTVLLAFTIGDRSLSPADVEATVLSVELTPEPTIEEKLAGLAFTFRAVEPFHVANVIPRTAAMLNSFVGTDPTDMQPVIVIGRTRANVLVGAEAQVAVELLKTTGGYRDAMVIEQGPATFAGGSGYRVAATLEGQSIVQYLRVVPGGSYLRLLARGETSAMASAAAATEEIAASVKLN